MSRWARLKHVLACSCQTAAELSSRQLDERLPWSDRLALAGHTLVCGSCRHFRRQLRFLRSATGSLASRMESIGQQEAQLSEAARQRIAQAIRETTSQ